MTESCLSLNLACTSQRSNAVDGVLALHHEVWLSVELDAPGNPDEKLCRSVRQTVSDIKGLNDSWDAASPLTIDALRPSEENRRRTSS